MIINNLSAKSGKSNDAVSTTGAASAKPLKRVATKTKNIVTYPARKVFEKIVDKVWERFNILK